MSLTRSIVGWLMLLVGAAVFAIRLQHDPYALPEGGNLRAGVLALAIGVFLVRPWLGTTRLASVSTGLALAASPIVLFFALYATFAELEEVIVLRAEHVQGGTSDLRLWIVDHEDSPWVTMPRSKADGHGLTEARVELVRHGETRCVIAERHEEFEAVDRIHRLRHEKYSVQRFATSIGLFGRSAGESTVALRLDPCPE